MHQFALFAGLIITALILNTVAFLLSVFLLYTLPEGVTSSVTAYAGILIALNLIAWLILLGGGAAILHQERKSHAPMALKLGIMLAVLLLFTIVFVLSCILLSVFQNDLQASLITPRNYTVSVLVLIFVAWSLILTGSALLATGKATPVAVLAMPYTPKYDEEELNKELDSYAPLQGMMNPTYSSPSSPSYSSPRGRMSSYYNLKPSRYYGMTSGNSYSMKSY
jgi:hypothetical protein